VVVKEKENPCTSFVNEPETIHPGEGDKLKGSKTTNARTGETDEL
jgi:hypothetical protein